MLSKKVFIILISAFGGDTIEGVTYKYLVDDFPIDRLKGLTGI